MKRFGLFAIIVLVGAIVGSLVLLPKKEVEKEEMQPRPEETTRETLKVSSPAFTEDGIIPAKYTCDGEDINPPLVIDGVETGSKSLVLIVDDPDAPAGTWTHWLVWNIDPGMTEILEDDVPEGAVVGKSDFGKAKYGGPCPPSGTHRYFFKVFALDILIDLPEGAIRRELEKAMKDHILAQGHVMAKYSK